MNGPAEGSSQVDSDLDGYGSACDADYDYDDEVNTIDFAIYLVPFTGSGPTTVTDRDGDGQTTTIDFAYFLSAFTSDTPTTGPSGLACAGISIPCIP